MAEQVPAPDDTQAAPRWLDDLRPGGEGEGFLEKNLRHSLMFVRRPVKRLLVTFDNLSNVGDDSVGREPWAFKFARDENISHLGVMAHVSDWYRNPDLIDRMKKLVKDGFFDGYDRVVFAGVSMGGYAAIAYGSLVPGAHVVSVNPQSTLNPDLVPWETRYENGQRQDWTLPLGDAAKLTKKLGRVSIFYDPYHALDQQHVDRFSGKNIRLFNCWFSNHKTAVFLRKIDALKPVMQHCIFDELTSQEFYRLYRARRYLPWYRGSLSSYFRELGRDKLGERIDDAFRRRLRRKKRLEEAETADPADPPEKDEDTAQHEIEAKPVVAPVPTKAAAKKESGRRAIVTTMKNEGPFMLEWVAYNRAIGFTDLLIYTNHCDDGTDKIAIRLDELGIAKHVENKFKKGASPQRVALRRALKQEIYQNCDWMICADCDEFLNIRAGGGTLDDLFEAIGDADAISLCWKLFGCGQQVDYEDRLVTEQFTWGAPEDYRAKFRALGLKTLFRPSEVIRKIGVHRPKFESRPVGFVWKDAGGVEMPEKYYDAGWSAHAAFNHTHARLHHYAVRSVDSFLVKRDRGRTNHIDRDQGVAYWADMNLNIAEDPSLLSTVNRTRAEFDKLIADPEIARLHEEACTWHRAKIDKLKSNEEWLALFNLLQTINRPGEMPVDRDHFLQRLAAG